MKNEILITGMLALMVASVGLFGCAPPEVEVPEATIKPCEVSVAAIETDWAGTESISITPIFTIYNPNDYFVTLGKMTYCAMVDDWLAGDRELLLNVAVPPMGESSVIVGTCALNWANMAGWYSGMAGIRFDEAIPEIVPLWKNLNGGLFNPALKEKWDAAPEKTPVFDITGRIEMESPEGQALTIDYSTTWQLPGEVKAFK